MGVPARFEEKKGYLMPCYAMKSHVEAMATLNDVLE